MKKINTISYKKHSLKERFHCYIDNSISKNKCWEWKGNFLKSGYGRFCYKFKYYRAHRASYQIYKGYIPEDKLVCHSCDNKKCVNPNHLWLGTIQENTKDRDLKNRTSRLKGEKNGYSKLKNNDIPIIRKKYKNGISQTKIAKEYNVTQNCISKLITGKNWKTF